MKYEIARQVDNTSTVHNRVSKVLSSTSVQVCMYLNWRFVQLAPMWLWAISLNVCGVGVGPTGRILQEPSGNMHFTCVGIVVCINATAILNV